VVILRVYLTTVHPNSIWDPMKRNKANNQFVQHDYWKVVESINLYHGGVN